MQLHIAGAQMAYKHFRHAKDPDPGTFLYWREGWEIGDPSSRYSLLHNWNLIATLDSIEQIPKQYREQVRRSGFHIYRKTADDDPATVSPPAKETFS
jgi:hypothetical protein